MIKYRIIDELNEPPMDEFWLRHNLYSLAVSGLEENPEDALTKELPIYLYFEHISIAIFGKIDIVIERLKEFFDLDVEVIEEDDKEDTICPYCESKQEEEDGIK